MGHPLVFSIEPPEAFSSEPLNILVVVMKTPHSTTKEVVEWGTRTRGLFD